MTTQFCAAHNLRGYAGKCESLHGHNWRVDVVLESSKLDESGMVMDFKEVKRLLGEILNKLDHKYLNEEPPFKTTNPTTENLSRFIFGELKGLLPEGVTVKRVTTWESEGCGASYEE